MHIWLMYLYHIVTERERALKWTKRGFWVVITTPDVRYVEMLGSGTQNEARTLAQRGMFAGGSADA